MNDAVFLDTNGLIALLNADDWLHEAAGIFLREFGASGRRLISTDWVVVETGNGLDRHFKQAGFNCLLPSGP